jgi:hypothetical protein
MSKLGRGVVAAAALMLLAGVGVVSLRAAGPQQQQQRQSESDIATRMRERRAAKLGTGPRKDRFFEMRTYHANEGKMDALNARFREHTNRLFQRHGIELVGYWQPVDQKDTLVYILAYPSQAARDASWKAFQVDPDAQKAKAESERGGVLVQKVDQVFMAPTDYSPIK